MAATFVTITGDIHVADAKSKLFPLEQRATHLLDVKLKNGVACGQT
jgi:hypothetical protein